MRLKKALATLIEQERVCRVATANPSGIPHVVPVCHVLADGKLYFGSAADAKKVVNLKANPRAAVTVDLTLLYRKYPHYPDEAALEESASVIVEVSPTRVFSWGLE